MTDANNNDNNNDSSNTKNNNDELFTNKLGKIVAQYNQLWSLPNAEEDIEAYMRNDLKHEYCRGAVNWIKENNNFQYDRITQRDNIIFAANDKALIIGNSYSFDVQQHIQTPNPAGMSFIHVLGISREQYFNGISLKWNNCDVIRDIIDLFESNWGVEYTANKFFRDMVVDNERNVVKRNTRTQVEKIQSDNQQNSEKVKEAALQRQSVSIDRWHELQYDARRLKPSDFSYGLHIWPDHSVPHLHVHIIAHPSPMRRYSSRDHDEKTVNAREVQDFISSKKPSSDGSERSVSIGGETNSITTNGEQDQPEPDETSTDSIVCAMSGLGISDTKA